MIDLLSFLMCYSNYLIQTIVKYSRGDSKRGKIACAFLPMTMTNRFWSSHEKTGLTFVEEACEEDSEISYLKPAVGSEYNPLHKNGRRASVSF